MKMPEPGRDSFACTETLVAFHSYGIFSFIDVEVLFHFPCLSLVAAKVLLIYNSFVPPSIFVENVHTTLRDEYKMSYHNNKSLFRRFHTPNCPLQSFHTLPSCIPPQHPESYVTGS